MLGIFALAQAKEIGLSQQNLSRLVASKSLKLVGRGIFLHPDAELAPDVGFRIAFAKFGPEAGDRWSIGTLPLRPRRADSRIHLGALPPGKRTSAKGYKLIRTKINLDNGIVSEKGCRMSSIERAVLEGGKRFITKIGEKAAIKAARNALATRRTTELKLGKAAKELRLESVLAKYLEVIIPCP